MLFMSSSLALSPSSSPLGPTPAKLKTVKPGWSSRQAAGCVCSLRFQRECLPLAQIAIAALSIGTFYLRIKGMGQATTVRAHRALLLVETLNLVPSMLHLAINGASIEGISFVNTLIIALNAALIVVDLAQPRRSPASDLESEVAHSPEELASLFSTMMVSYVEPWLLKCAFPAFHITSKIGLTVRRHVNKAARLADVPTLPMSLSSPRGELSMVSGPGAFSFDGLRCPVVKKRTVGSGKSRCFLRCWAR